MTPIPPWAFVCIIFIRLNINGRKVKLNSENDTNSSLSITTSRGIDESVTCWGAFFYHNRILIIQPRLCQEHDIHIVFNDIITNNDCLVSSYSLRSSFISCLIRFFQSFVSVTFLFHSFEISFCYDIVLFPDIPLIILRFPFLKVVTFFSLFHSFKPCSHSHREARTNMHDKGTTWRSMILMNHPFARPLLHWAVRCMYRP